jgi:DNA repair exonuclease SbcCD ATPase subunit
MLLLDRYTKAAILAKEAWNNVVTEHKSRHMTLQAFEDQLKAMQPEEEINARIAEFSQAVTTFDQQMEEIRTRREGLVAQDREYRTLLSNLESQVVRAQDLLTKKTIELDQDLRELESSIKSAEAEIATIPQYREAIQRLEADTKVAEVEIQKIQLARGRQQELTRTLQQQQQRMLVASQMADICPLCKEKISAERRREILAEMQVEMAQVSSELSAIEQALQLSARIPAPAQLRAELEQTQSRLTRTETKIVTRQELVGRLATVKEKRVKVLQELSNDLTDLSQRVDTTRAKLNAEVEALANQIEAIKVQRVPFSKQLESWSHLKLNRKSTEENRDLQIQYLDMSKAQESEVEFVAEALAPAGIPLMIIDSYLPLIEARARELLAKMSNGALDLKMAVVEAGTKKGIDLFAGVGVLRPIRALSGGEQTRVALAVRLALSQMLTETSGSSFDVLILDEMEYLDSDGIDQMIQTIDRLQDQFSQIFVISHYPALRQAFARTISVEKVDGSSQVKVL